MPIKNFVNRTLFLFPAIHPTFLVSGLQRWYQRRMRMLGHEWSQFRGIILALEWAVETL